MKAEWCAPLQDTASLLWVGVMKKAKTILTFQRNLLLVWLEVNSRTSCSIFYFSFVCPGRTNSHLQTCPRSSTPTMNFITGQVLGHVTAECFIFSCLHLVPCAYVCIFSLSFTLFRVSTSCSVLSGHVCQLGEGQEFPKFDPMWEMFPPCEYSVTFCSQTEVFSCLVGFCSVPLYPCWECSFVFFKVNVFVMKSED